MKSVNTAKVNPQERLHPKQSLRAKIVIRAAFLINQGHRCQRASTKRCS